MFFENQEGMNYERFEQIPCFVDDVISQMKRFGSLVLLWAETI